MTRAFFTLGLVLYVRATANAQDAGRVGLSIQYPTSEFAVFGETGIGYSHAKASSALLPTGSLASQIASPDTTSSNVAIRSGVGVVFYF